MLAMIYRCCPKQELLRILRILSLSHSLTHCVAFVGRLVHNLTLWAKWIADNAGFASEHISARINFLRASHFAIYKREKFVATRSMDFIVISPINQIVLWFCYIAKHTCESISKFIFAQRILAD